MCVPATAGSMDVDGLTGGGGKGPPAPAAPGAPAAAGAGGAPHVRDGQIQVVGRHGVTFADFYSYRYVSCGIIFSQIRIRELANPDPRVS